MQKPLVSNFVSDIFHKNRKSMNVFSKTKSYSLDSIWSLCRVAIEISVVSLYYDKSFPIIPWGQQVYFLENDISISFITATKTNTRIKGYLLDMLISVQNREVWEQHGPCINIHFDRITLKFSVQCSFQRRWILAKHAASNGG